jgi:hypothetical protein
MKTNIFILLNVAVKPIFAVAAILSFVAPLVRADNPIVPNVGLTDPHVSIFGDRAYLYASHDASP